MLKETRIQKHPIQLLSQVIATFFANMNLKEIGDCQKTCQVWAFFHLLESYL